jgi:hypothetical protein
MNQVIANQQIKSNTKVIAQRLELQFDNLKDILIHSKAHKNFDAYIIVAPTRFRKILSDYISRNALSVEGMLDNYSEHYDHFTFNDLDKNNNSYRIIKNSEIKEVKSKCVDCDCGRKRYLNPNTNVCYYREAVNKNYTTKI